MVQLDGLWRHADFRKLWLGQTISQFGSQITMLALPLIAATLLGASPIDMGFLAAAEMAPFLLVGLPAGVWVDRLPRRPILIVGDLGRALALVTVPAAHLLDLLTMTHLYLVAFLTGVLTVFFDVAYMSYLPSLVGRERLVEGNSKMESTRAAAQIAGPGLGGTLVQTLGAPLAILCDAVSFLISAVFCAAIQAREDTTTRGASATSNGLLAEVREGLQFVLGHPLLRPIAACTAISNLCSSALWALYILFAVTELGLDASQLGFIFGLGNLGILAGALAAGRIAKWIGVGPAIIGSALVGALGMLLVPLTTPDTAVLLLTAAGGIIGASISVFNINQVSLRQTICPARLQGRMNATMRFLVWGTMPLGSLLGGALGESLGLRGALSVAAAGGMLAFLPALLSPVRALHVQPAPVEP